MGKTKGPYNYEYAIGTIVRIAPMEQLLEFKKTWKYHHKLETNQLSYAGREAEVVERGIYHGGDELYRLVNVPGIWHEACLSPE